MNPAHTFYNWSTLVGTLDRVTSADAQSLNVDDAGLATMPWLVAFDGEDSLAHARRVADAADAADGDDDVAVLVESAGEEDAGTPKRSYTFYSSALTAPLSKP